MSHGQAQPSPHLDWCSALNDATRSVETDGEWIISLCWLAIPPAALPCRELVHRRPSTTC